MKTLLLLALFLTQVFALESLPKHLPYYKHSKEIDLHINYGLKIEPHYQSSKLKFFKGRDNFNIAYKIFKVKNPKASIIISSGRTEGMIKYKELIYDLNMQGYNIYIFDHRGQGFSTRLDKKHRDMGDVQNFNYYVDDLNYFVENIVKKDKHKHLFLLSHSMGGAISALYLEKYHDVFDGAVLSSPMLQAKLISRSASKLFCSILSYDKKSKYSKYIQGSGDYEFINNFDENKNIYTHSMLRYSINENEFRLNKNARVSGPSIRWVVESCEASAKAVEEAYKIKTPILLLQAGDDNIVNLKPQDKFCKNANGFCHGYKVDGAEHELFIEQDKYRDKAINAIFTFFDLVLDK